ncbi:hypothetical protein VNO77_26947 [Canavalia gladiata]|uniref:Bet v I/Major latex protein domain-containing protein n=1 Tax=Canavalia gladiata TaxID=3824 RepID=A0AAN9KWB3_CANGL
MFSIALIGEVNMAGSELPKLESKVHINASAEQFHDILCNRTYHIANICPQKIQAVNIHKGEWGSEGSIITWNILQDGKAYVSKEVVEGIDRENNKVTFRPIEGDLSGLFKGIKFIVQVTPKVKGSDVHWIMEYEKQCDHTLDPQSFLDMAIDMSKDIDAYLTKDQK